MNKLLFIYDQKEMKWFFLSDLCETPKMNTKQLP